MVSIEVDGEHSFDINITNSPVKNIEYSEPKEKEMATHSSVLAWRIPGTGEPDGLPSVGSHRVGHD